MASTCLNGSVCDVHGALRSLQEACKTL
jgi:hypothetical protein